MEQMYNEAEPGLDFMDLLENSDEYPDDWYSQHTLSSERQQEIFEEHVEAADLSDREHTQLSIECIVNLGPSSEY
jgi:Tat protein secretion system quality control protein TatD with DNase activity